MANFCVVQESAEDRFCVCISESITMHSEDLDQAGEGREDM